ncbi:MAG: YDG domain-containing protein, partial [Planctomycetaceae bacterium]
MLAVTSVNIASPQSGLGMRAQVAAGEAFDVNYTAVTNLTQPLNGVNLLSTQLIATLDSTGTPTVAAKSWGGGVQLVAADTISATAPLNVTAGTYKLTVTVTQTWSTAAGGTVTSTADTFQNNSVVVTAAATTTTTVASPATAVYGSNATFTATVSGNPSVGTVQFYVGSIAPANVIGSPVNVTGGTASLTSNPLLGVGSYTILAAYSGGAGFQASSGSSTANAFSVTKAALTVTPTADQSKVYGDSDLTFTYGVSGLVNSDTAATAITGGALSRAAGETVAGGPYSYTLGTLASGNYTLSLGGTNTFDITPLTITGAFTAADKTFDGSTAATITARFLTGVLGLDIVSFTGGTATFDTAAVGTSKTVTLTGATLTGTDAGNYTLGAATCWTTTAAITAVAVDFPERSAGTVATVGTDSLPFAGPYSFQINGGADASFFTVSGTGQLGLNSPLD